MAGKIFYRERRKIKDGEKKPRFRIVGVHDCKLKIYMDHFRMSELECLSQETGAELVALPMGPKKESKKKNK